MPSVSKRQQRLMGAAEHGAQFPAAKALRRSMTHQQLHDFASGSMKGKPERSDAHHGLTITEHHRGSKRKG